MLQNNLKTNIMNNIVDLTKVRKDINKKQNVSNLKSILSQDISFSQKLSIKKKFAFYNDLFVLLDASIDIIACFELIIDNQKKRKEKEIFEKIKNRVMNGLSLSEALKDSGLFSSYEYSSIKIGEETGKIISVVESLKNFFQRRIDQKRKIQSALSYPIIVLITTIGAIAFMLQFIIPMFEDVFKRFNNELPALTQKIISMSHFFEKYFFIGLLGLGLVILFLNLNRKKIWYRKFSSNLVMRIPLFGNLIKKINLAKFSMSMQLLMEAKSPLINSIDLIKEMISYYPIQQSLLQVKKDLLKGESLHKSLSQFLIYDRRMLSLIKIGEEVNQLDKVFEKLKEQYNNEIDHQTASLSNLLEPLMIIVIGLLVGIILIAMYLPMFQMSTSLSF